MSSFEHLLSEVLEHGERRTDRTGTGTLSLFAPDPLRYDLRDGRVALITSKKVPWKMALNEFMWMLTGSTNVEHLRQWSPAMANIWEAWANADGKLGPTYGAQYRDAGGSLTSGEEVWGVPGGKPDYGVDQLREVVLRLMDNRDTRRAVLSLWSVPELRDMAIEPCMVLFQFSLRGPNYDQLHVHVYQRSADMMLGVPFDLFQASMLAHLVARELTLLQPARPITAAGLTWSAGDVHIYSNQFAAAREQLVQAESAGQMSATIDIDTFPSLRLLDSTLEPSHITIRNYNPAPAIDAGKPAV
ncbi:thymidylate synthase [Microbacterium phage Abigail]|uniref:thymidylate synthase n=1 Tax=Microbacterium phage Abigail TaxID=2851101 RepID=UPI001C769248|nr:thymidylate synthase [Microbacterium phage Abigail]QXN73559.1 thymidylate synthase [Microbacterium phage Abigail]